MVHLGAKQGHCPKDAWEGLVGSRRWCATRGRGHCSAESARDQVCVRLHPRSEHAVTLGQSPGMALGDQGDLAIARAPGKNRTIGFSRRTPLTFYPLRVNDLSGLHEHGHPAFQLLGRIRTLSELEKHCFSLALGRTTTRHSVDMTQRGKLGLHFLKIAPETGF